MDIRDEISTDKRKSKVASSSVRAFVTVEGSPFALIFFLLNSLYIE